MAIKNGGSCNPGTTPGNPKGPNLGPQRYLEEIKRGLRGTRSAFGSSHVRACRLSGASRGSPDAFRSSAGAPAASPNLCFPEVKPSILDVRVRRVLRGCPSGPREPGVAQVPSTHLKSCPLGRRWGPLWRRATKTYHGLYSRPASAEKERTAVEA